LTFKADCRKTAPPVQFWNCWERVNEEQIALEKHGALTSTWMRSDLGEERYSWFVIIEQKRMIRASTLTMAYPTKSVERNLFFEIVKNAGVI
jgi:hypothetical protein